MTTINKLCLCKHCNGTGKSDQNDRCIPPNFYNCEHCDGYGISKEIDIENIYLFKVYDYSTTLIGRKSEKYFYIERGDGTRYNYEIDRVKWCVPILEVLRLG